MAAAASALSLVKRERGPVIQVAGSSSRDDANDATAHQQGQGQPQQRQTSADASTTLLESSSTFSGEDSRGERAGSAGDAQDAPENLTLTSTSNGKNDVKKEASPTSSSLVDLNVRAKVFPPHFRFRPHFRSPLPVSGKWSPKNPQFSNLINNNQKLIQN